MKILVIDDDTRLLLEIGKILVRNGHSADLADNADDAMTLLGANRYDFVLVDYRMPNHDGIWFMKNAAIPRTTKTLLMTFCADREVVKRMFHLGISGYVIKPFDENELLMHLDFHSGAESESSQGRKPKRRRSRSLRPASAG